MPSSLTWIDHDPTARERALRILSVFQEMESRDELGLGAIRDSFAVALFPGTSTIQTRLRYMLFVPWVYADLEKRRISPPEFAARARQMEMASVDPLLSNSDHAGINFPSGSNVLFGLLESMVIPTKAPRGGVFHHKMWVLRFVQPDIDEPPLIRLLILSRNITYDRS